MQVDDEQSLGRDVNCECVNGCVLGQFSSLNLGFVGPSIPEGLLFYFSAPGAGHQRARLRLGFPRDHNLIQEPCSYQLHSRGSGGLKTTPE